MSEFNEANFRFLNDIKSPTISIQTENSMDVEMAEKLNLARTEKLKVEHKTQKGEVKASKVVELKPDNTLEKIKITTVSCPANSDKPLKTYVIKRPDKVKMSDLNVSSQSIVPVNRGDSKSFNVKLIKTDPVKYCVSESIPVKPPPSQTIESEDTKTTSLNFNPNNVVILDSSLIENEMSESKQHKKSKDIFKPTTFLTSSPIESQDNPKVRKAKKNKENNESGESDKILLDRSGTPIEENSNDNSNLSDSRRNMRSQNQDFSIKQQKFLKSINTENEISDNSDDENTDKMSEMSGKSLESRNVHPAVKLGWDPFCWRCHADGLTMEMIACKSCKRTHHFKCLKATQIPSNHEDFECPECVESRIADNSPTQKNGKKKLSVDHLCSLLEFSINRMMNVKGSSIFMLNIDKSVYRDYENFVVNPMTLDILQTNITNRKYKSVEAFMQDCKYILHNCIIYPGMLKFKPTAKCVVKVARQEVNDIETCSECYQNANSNKFDWFVEVCSRPHILLWAKLKGFPYWPAKGMAVNANGLVDVRFFGAHDRAWIATKECLLYSEKDPNSAQKYKRNNITESIKEVNIHIEKLSERFGEFIPAPFKTTYDPANELSQLQMMLPNFKDAESSNNESGQKSKLTLKIIKTADNNLSIAAKDESSPDNITKNANYEILHKTPSPNEFEGKTSDDGGNGKIETMIFKRKADDDQWTKKINLKKHKKQLQDSQKSVNGQKLNEEAKLHKRKRSNTSPNGDETTITTKNIRTDLINVSNEDSMPISVISISSESDKSIELEKNGHVKNETVPEKRITRSKSISEKRIDRKEIIEKISKSLSDNDMKGRKESSDENIHRRKSLAREAKSKTQTKSQETHIKSESKDNNKISISATPSPKNSIVNSETEKINIKSEPLSEDEEAERSKHEIRKDKITVKDLHDLMSESTDNKKKTIILTTTDSDKSQKAQNLQLLQNHPVIIASNSNDSYSQTHKTFPNNARNFTNPVKQPASFMPRPQVQQIIQQMSNNNSMVFIPLNLKEVPPLAAINNNNSSNVHITSPTNQHPSKATTSTNTITKSTATNTSTVNLNNNQTPVSENCPIITPSTSSTSNINVPKPVISSITSTVQTSNVNENHQSTESLDLNSGITTAANVNQPLANGVVETDKPVNMLIQTAGISVNFASAVTEAITSGPPKLTKKPIGPMKSDGDVLFPSDAGPVSRTLAVNSHKMADFFRSVIEDTLADLAGSNMLEAKVKLLEAEIENLKHAHKQEMMLLKHNTDNILREMRNSMEAEKTRIINEVRKQCELERIRSVERAIDDTKRKQWCSNCGKEAEFYCCWNTSYCDLQCQQQHWPKHMSRCSQAQALYNNSSGNKGKVVNANKDFMKTNTGTQVSNPTPPAKRLNSTSNVTVTGNTENYTHPKKVVVYPPSSAGSIENDAKRTLDRRNRSTTLVRSYPAPT